MISICGINIHTSTFKENCDILSVRSSHSGVFLGKGILKTCSKFRGKEHQCCCNQLSWDVQNHLFSDICVFSNTTVLLCIFWNFAIYSVSSKCSEKKVFLEISYARDSFLIKLEVSRKICKFCEIFKANFS